MNLEEYEKLIVDTSEDDWTRISCWGAGSGPSYYNRFDVWSTLSGKLENMKVDSHSEYYSLKRNLLVSIACGIDSNEDFKEEWANKFMDSHASSHFVDFFYSGVLVYRDIYVSVDGGRALLPLPKRIFDEERKYVKELIISKKRYEFFKLINGYCSDYDSYIQDVGFKLVDMDWMTGDGY
ncbi:hypothetical protein [uncultured Treponema sp.]|uniref:hypothetical protein n=1 Tax=uncultured Treponema sp. TaxID=162155 RepID=UPI0025920C1C|nr:hypothetical protein [uncultured Treponema sp.]